MPPLLLMRPAAAASHFGMAVWTRPFVSRGRLDVVVQRQIRPHFGRDFGPIRAAADCAAAHEVDCLSLARPVQ
jgi:hypothetical protein